MLGLPEPIRQKIAYEFRFAANGMANTSDLASKVYFFSAFYGEINRALNQLWSADLALLHSVLVFAHQTIQGRVEATKSGDAPVGWPSEFSDAFTQIGDKLAVLFESPDTTEEELYRLYSKLAELAYAVTGNGYYLYLKGEIKI